MRLKLERSHATNDQIASPNQTVMQTGRLARIETYTPAAAHVTYREMRDTDIEHSKQMVQNHVRGYGRFEYLED